MQVERTSLAVAELCSHVADPAWFCIRSHLKHEHIAAAHLRQVPDVEVFSPRLRLLRSTRRGREWCAESLFPNYLFARFDLESRLERVQYTPSVKMVLRFGDTVPSIPDAIIQELQRDLELTNSQVLVAAPEEGEEVEVAAGAFKGANGRVTRVLPAKQRVEILLDLMGRSIMTELSLDLVLFKRKDAANLVLHEADISSARRPRMAGLDRPVAVLPRTLQDTRLVCAVG